MFFYNLTVNSDEMYMLMDALLSHRYAFPNDTVDITALLKHLRTVQPVTLEQLKDNSCICVIKKDLPVAAVEVEQKQRNI